MENRGKQKQSECVSPKVLALDLMSSKVGPLFVQHDEGRHVVFRRSIGNR
jgi:hypothetical protein